MAELNTATRTKVAQTAGNKAPAASHNRLRTMVIESPAAWSAANGDTAGTALVLPLGARLALPVTMSNAAGAASSTVSVGIRDNITKVAIDATAVLAATSLTSATTAQYNTGTKLINGQTYLMPQDVELYLTFAGAAPTANQAYRIEVSYIAP